MAETSEEEWEEEEEEESAGIEAGEVLHDSEGEGDVSVVCSEIIELEAPELCDSTYFDNSPEL